MERDADVVVVGAGIVGCATAYFLARRGVRVVVLERGHVPGEQSRKNWGFVRQQGRDPLELPLVMEANRLWRGLERELGADIEWIQGGNLALAADDTRMARFEAWLPAAREFGLETRLLRARDLQAVVPGLGGAWAGGMHTPGDGHADPEKTTDAFARAARAHGASLYLESAVQGVSTRAGAVSGVVTERGDTRAGGDRVRGLGTRRGVPPAPRRQLHHRRRRRPRPRRHARLPAPAPLLPAEFLEEQGDAPLPRGPAAAGEPGGGAAGLGRASAAARLGPRARAPAESREGAAQPGRATARAALAPAARHREALGRLHRRRAGSRSGARRGSTARRLRARDGLQRSRLRDGAHRGPPRLRADRGWQAVPRHHRIPLLALRRRRGRPAAQRPVTLVI